MREFTVIVQRPMSIDALKTAGTVVLAVSSAELILQTIYRWTTWMTALRSAWDVWHRAFGPLTTIMTAFTVVLVGVWTIEAGRVARAGLHSFKEAQSLGGTRFFASEAIKIISLVGTTMALGQFLQDKDEPQLAMALNCTCWAYSVLLVDWLMGYALSPSQRLIARGTVPATQDDLEVHP